MKQRIILLWFGMIALAGCSGKNRNSALPKPPQLIVFIAIDQFPYEYLTRFDQYFGKDGFRKLLDGGANFTNCSYAQATTQTSVGHSVMMSGMNPSEQGIIANYWYDRTLKRKVYSCEDTTTTILGMKQKSSQDGRSPHYFVGTNLADQLRAHTRYRSKVFGLSNKDRSAIMMAGKRPNGAYWFNESTGGVISSTYYMPSFPGWVSDYNAGKSYDRWLWETWTLSLDPAQYPTLTPEVLSMISPPTPVFGKTFPHKLSDKDKPDAAYYKALMGSPFGSEELVDFADLLIKKEELGKDDDPDILCVSFSSNDKVGHNYGPSSPEVMDISIRTDRSLARLIAAAESAVGEGNVLFVLTSDHGIAPMPEDVTSKGIDAGRITPDALERWIDSVMTLRYGPSGKAGRYAARITYPDFFFNDAALAEKKIDKEEAEDYITASLMNGGPGVFRAYTGNRLMRGEVAPDEVSRAVYRSYFSGRSGDVVIVLKPYYLWDIDGFGTEHSLPYAYDAHVPLIIKGKRWVRGGIYTGSCSPADIAPTLATLLGINASGGTAHEPLDEILKFSK